MSYGEKIFVVVTTLSEDVGEMKSDINHMKKDISDLKSKKLWYQKVNWVKVGKGTAYVVLSAAALAGGTAGVSSLLEFLR